MNPQLRELYDGYERRSKDELANFVRDKFIEIADKYLQNSKTHDKDMAMRFALATFSCFIAQDNKLADWEWSLVEFVFQRDMTCDEAFNLTNNAYDSSFYPQLKDICTRDESMKRLVLVMGLAICAIDGNIDEKESDLIEFLM